MASNGGRRNRRHRRRGAASERDAVAQQPAQSDVVGKRQRKRNRPANRGGRRSQLDATKLLIGGSVLAVGALVIVVLASVLSGGGAASDFSFDVYQGQDLLGGDEINFSTLLDDGKPLVLNFWAGECPPCRAEMPALQAVWDEHKDDLTFVGLDVGVFTGLGTRQDALELLQELNITYPAGAPSNGTAVRNFSVRSMPTTVFFGADGEVFRRWDGAISESQMNSIVNDMLEAVPAS